MPPAGLPRPDERGYDAFLAPLIKSLDARAAAKPNPAELKKLQSYAETKDAASGFAGSGQLKAQRVEYPK
jgi:hypothetical protein